MEIERRHKNFFELPFVNAVIGGIILAIIVIPIQLFSSHITKISASPDKIKEICYQIDVLKKDVEDIKLKNQSLDEAIIRLEKIVVKLDYIVVKLDK